MESNPKTQTGGKKRKFLVVKQIKSASGYQAWSIEARSPEEACELVDAGGGEFDHEEVEVTSLENADPQECEELESK